MFKLSILRYASFSTGFDLGNMDQTVWNTLHGHFFSLTTNDQNVSRFAHHADITLIFFAPLYALWNSPHTLNFIESLSLGLAAIPIYLIAIHLLKNKTTALLLSILYLLSPTLQWIDMFDFHSVSLSIPAILCAFYCVLKKKWQWYGFFLLLAILTKEEVSLQIAILGLIVAYFFKQKKIGFITFFIGIGWFLSMVFVVIPYFSVGNYHWAFEWFQLGNGSHLSLFETIQSKVGFILDRFFFSPESKQYYMLLLKSSGSLPLFGLPWLVLGLPDFLINILSSHEETRTITHHYVSGLMPALVLASLYGISYISIVLKKIDPLKKYSGMIIYCLIILAYAVVLRTNYHYSPLPTTEACNCSGFVVNADDKAFENVLQSIPQEASVTSSIEIHTHVTHRINSYMLPYATQSADFIALMDKTKINGPYDPKLFELNLIKELEQNDTYIFIKHIGRYYLYKKALVHASEEY